MWIRRTAVLLIVAAVAAAAWFKVVYYPHPSARASYYFAAFVFGAIAAIALLLSSMAREKHRRERLRWTELYAGNRRETFRIPYPEDERPEFVLEPEPAGRGKAVAPVLDVSEEGVRFVLRPPLDVGTEVRGTIRFPKGEVVPVAGRVVRVQEDQVCLHLTRPVPARVIVEETRRLRDHLKPRRS